MDNSIEMQYKLLGAYINNPELFSHIENLVSKDIFTTSVMQAVYKIIKAYHARNIKPDISLIHSNLIKLGFDKKDCAIVAQLQDSYMTEVHVTEYVTNLFDSFVVEYLTPILKEGLQHGRGIDQMIKIKDAITKVELVLNNVSKDKSSKIQFKETLTRIKELKSGKITQYGFSWGLPSLDKKTLGIVQGINIVAADKGGGKSTILVNIVVENPIKNKIPMLFFSMEMTAVEFLTNVIANIKEINSRSLRTGDIDDNQMLSIEEIENRLGDHFVIDETGGITWQYFEAKVKSFRKRLNIPYSQTILVALDYLGLMKNSSDESRMSKEEKVEQICTELMRICKNENIALVKLAQFSRESSKRGNDTFNIKTDADRLKALRPRMSDLKGSAAIESNAVTILLLYRPEYYQILEANGMNFKGLCEINIAKGRYVNPEPVYVNFEGKYSLFRDIEKGVVSNDSDPF